MSSKFNKPFDVSEELAKLRHEKKNHALQRLPPNTTIQRRPLNHAPIVSPFAGAGVQKVVYVSRRTPIMSTVKRVKKLLQQVEKRAVQASHVGFVSKGEREGMRKLAEASEKLRKDKEEVVVKASGRAMEQALRVAEWFRNKEDEILCNVEVRTGNVAAVDDIVDVSEAEEEGLDEETVQTSTAMEVSALEEGDTTRELFGELSKTQHQTSSLEASKQDVAIPNGDDRSSGKENEATRDEKAKRRRKRKKPMYDKDDLPEARIRWVKTVEIGIYLKG